MDQLPVGVLHVGADGSVRHGELSARNHLADHAIGAFVVRGWWLLPVPRRVTGSVDAGIMVVRRAPGEISPNQAEHLHRIVTTAALAFERAAMQERLHPRRLPRLAPPGHPRPQGSRSSSALTTPSRSLRGSWTSSLM